MKSLAGHMMQDGPDGYVCIYCGRTWIDMLNNRDRWRSGEINIAHFGGLSDGEIKELNAEIERIWAAVMS